MAQIFSSKALRIVFNVFSSWQLLLGLIISLILIYFAISPSISLFSLHPICMSLAYLYLTCCGIQAIHEKRKSHSVKTKTTLSKLHFTVQTVVWGLTLVGFFAIYVNKIRYGKPHFTTIHSWLGLITMMLVFLNFLGGLSETFSSKSAKLKWHWKNKAHRYGGIVSFLFSGLCIVYGIDSKWGEVKLGSSGVMALSCGVCVIHVFNLINASMTFFKNSKLSKNK